MYKTVIWGELHRTVIQLIIPRIDTFVLENNTYAILFMPFEICAPALLFLHTIWYRFLQNTQMSCAGSA